MKQVEITAIPPLTPGEQSVVDFHSIINVLNVLRCELMVVGDMIAGNTDLLSRGMKLCEDLLRTMSDHDATLRQAARVDEFERQIKDEIKERLVGVAPDAAQFAESMANLESVFTILTSEPGKYWHVRQRLIFGSVTPRNSSGGCCISFSLRWRRTAKAVSAFCKTPRFRPRAITTSI